VTGPDPTPHSPDAWTVRRVLDFAIDDFRQRGLDTPRLDAELLLCHVLGVDRVRLIVDPLRPLDPEQLKGYREAIQRRRKREPIAYILGEREFYGLPFRVDRRVLIPRPDTETLVDVALQRTAHVDLCGRALDLCTGSACVAIAFARQRSTWRVMATDVSSDAIAVARDNAERLGAVWNLSFALGDLDSPLRPDERFHLITANPPYIAESEKAELTRDIVDYEPHLALMSGADGLDCIRRIVALAPRRLETGGILALEVASTQARATAELLERSGLAAVEIARDMAGHERVVSARAS
jgi:release factor glutamine methyltransferase